MIVRTAALLALFVSTMAASKPVSPQISTSKVVLPQLPAAKNLQTVLQVAALGSPSHSLYALADHSVLHKDKDKDRDKIKHRDRDDDRDNDRDEECKEKHHHPHDEDCRPGVSPD